MFKREPRGQMLGIAAGDPAALRGCRYGGGPTCDCHLICHGGLIFTLADSTFAFACKRYNQSTVALGCTIDFMAPGKAGDC